MRRSTWRGLDGRERRLESCLKPLFGEAVPDVSRRTSLLIAVGALLLSLAVGSVLGILASHFQDIWWTR